MTKKIPSKKTYKVCYITALIFGIFCLFIGIPTITAGGFIFLLFGAFFLFLYHNYKKIWKNYDATYNKQTTNEKKETVYKTPEVYNSSDVSIIKTSSSTTSILETQVNAEESIVKSNISKTHLTKEKLHVAGTSYRQKEIKSLGTENYDYSLSKKEIEEIYLESDRIYELDFIVNKVELIEEPTNEYDPNAIKVVVDDVHVGYIKKGSCSHVKKLMRENKIQKLEVDIHGGKYKLLEYDYDTDKYSISRNTNDFFVDLYIYKKE